MISYVVVCSTMRRSTLWKKHMQDPQEDTSRPIQEPRKSYKQDIREFISKCDICQRMGRPLKQNQMPLIPINPSQMLEIWAIDFVGSFSIPSRRTGAHYIITTVKYVTKWAEAEAVETCSSEVAAKFIYKNIIVRFGCPMTLISNQGSHFMNKTIDATEIRTTGTTKSLRYYGHTRQPIKGQLIRHHLDWYMARKQSYHYTFKGKNLSSHMYYT